MQYQYSVDECVYVCGQLLIGYNRGLIVLWDCKTNQAEQIYNAAQVTCCLPEVLYEFNGYRSHRKPHLSI